MSDVIFGSFHHPNKHSYEKQQKDDQGEDRVDLYVIDRSQNFFIHGFRIYWLEAVGFCLISVPIRCK